MTDHGRIFVNDDYGSRLRAAYETIRAAFEGVGVGLKPMAGSHLSYWINGTTHDEDRYQDPRSRMLIEAVAQKATALRNALAEAWEYSGYSEDYEAGPGDEGEKINLCETFFYEDPSADCAWPVMNIEMTASLALDRGRKVAGAGRPAHYAYYRFIRQLNEVYVEHVGTRGFTDKNGTAEGPFINVVIGAQAILPDAFRIPSPTPARIGSRVLKAFQIDFDEPEPQPSSGYEIIED